MAYTLDDADAPTRKAVQYFEMMGHRGIYADGWKAVTRHDFGTLVRRRPLGAVPPRRRTARSATTWPSRAARAPGRADRAVVGRGRGAGRAAARRPHDRAVRRPLPRALAAPPRPPLHLLPADDAAAGADRAGARRAQLGHDRDDRPPGGRRAACSTRPAPRTRASACSSTTTTWCSTTTASVTTTSCAPSWPVPVGASQVGVQLRRTGRGGVATVVVDGAALRQRRAALRHAGHVEHRPERRVRPRLAGQPDVLGPVAVRGRPAPGRHPAASLGPTRLRPRSRTPGSPRPTSVVRTPNSERPPTEPRPTMTDARSWSPPVWRSTSTSCARTRSRPRCGCARCATSSGWTSTGASSAWRRSTAKRARSTRGSGSGPTAGR